MSRFVNPRPQFFNDAGQPLALGKLFIFESGSNKLKAIFADTNLEVTTENPHILSASGRVGNLFFDGSSNQILTDADEVQFWQVDPVGGDAVTGSFSSWNALTVYSTDSIVTGDDNNFYISITDGNQNNEPSASPTDWSQIRFTRVYNANETYSIDQIVQASDGLLYTSLTDNNLNNNPVTDTINWTPSVTVDVPPVVLAAGFNYAYDNF